MIRLSRIVLSCALLGLAAASCDSPIAPSSVAGTYVLERIGAAPLPAVIVDNPDVTVTVLADTFRLRANGTAVDERIVRVEPHATGTAPSVDLWRDELDYHLRGSRIILTSPKCLDECPFILRIEPADGRFTAEGLVIENEPEYLYHRID